MTFTKTFSWLIERMLSIGVSRADDTQRTRLIRQINGLNLFYAFVALSGFIVVSNFIKSSMPLGIVQAFATVLYIFNLVIMSRRLVKPAANLTIYVFEAQMFFITLITNAWHSQTISIIVLYPLLAALVEVSIFRHLFIGFGQAGIFYAMHKLFPVLETTIGSAGNITGQGVEVLSILSVIYTPTIAAVIMFIIFNENQRAQNKEKVMLNEITLANKQSALYADQLKDETHKLRAEVSIAKKIQTMVLPTAEEVSDMHELDIACIMRTATEVGGDYYDIIKTDHNILIGIGDVTGHGLSSGLVMLMAQTAIRTLAEYKKARPEEFLAVLNRVLYANVTRIKDDRSMTLILMTYDNNRFVISGQHESIIICRKNGEIEVTDTGDNGFYVGMTRVPPVPYESMEFRLEKDDVLFLYTDGVTEAENESKRQFGLDNLCETLRKYHNLPAEKIKNKFMKDLYNYMGETEIYDDISLVVIKQK